MPFRMFLMSVRTIISQPRLNLWHFVSEISNEIDFLGCFGVEKK